MCSQRDRVGFTFIEVLIVVVIITVLAATIFPQFSSSTKDAQETSLKLNLDTLRSQIERYKLHHNGSWPDGTSNLRQLTMATNASGVTGKAGVSFPYGPYVYSALPVNPFNNSNKVTLVAGTDTPTASGSSDAGWLYRASSGDVWIDDASYLTW